MARPRIDLVKYAKVLKYVIAAALGWVSAKTGLDLTAVTAAF